jgi:beta-lactamase superfamily II metal-dependent hydrolase
MKLRVFQSDHGDCLLLTTADGKNMLIDGGLGASFGEHAAPFLGQMHAAGSKLDLVYVSHIDEDHIQGILKLVDTKVAWKVHEFQTGEGLAPDAPELPEPPDIGAVWHNGFGDMIEDATQPIEDVLSTRAAALSMSEEMADLAQASGDLATSIRQGVMLSHRLNASQLNIPLNPQFGGKLVMVRPGMAAVPFGSSQVSVVGPFKADVAKLRREWKAWLDDNEDKVEALRRQAARDRENLGLSEFEGLLGGMLAQATVFGNRSAVSTPNLASLMLLVEENGKRVLLTGDGHSDDVEKGLAHHGLTDAQGKLHLNVLKVMHHGSEKNITPGFCLRVTADKYVFCGDGFSTNPELDVVDLIAKKRKETDTKKFKFFFNCRHTILDNALRKAHMKKLEDKVKRLAAASGNRMTFSFNESSHFSINV